MATTSRFFSGLLPLVILGAVLAFALQTPPAGSGQDPAGGAQEQGDPGLPEGPLAPADIARLEMLRLQTEIEGAWRLMTFISATGTFRPDQFTGYAVFSRGYLSIILHGSVQEDELAADEVLFQSGLFHYRIDERGVLQAASIMSHTNITESGLTEIEPPNTPREYGLQLFGEFLTLIYSDGSRMQFRRLGDSNFPDAAARQLHFERR